MELSAAYCNSNQVIGDQWDLSFLWENTKDYSDSFTSNTISGSPVVYYPHNNYSEKPKKYCDSPTILSFGCPDESIVMKAEDQEMKSLMKSNSGGAKRSYETMVSQKKRPSPYEHVIAERVRREKLTQKFIALSALVPGLKKMDKASVLGDAIEYMKKLQQKVETLEKQAVDVVTVINKYSDQELYLANNDIDGNYEKNILPDIEVRLSAKSFLIKIHCGNQKGVVVKVLSEIENLHLTVTNTSAVVPFENTSSLYITVIAQIEEKFSMSTVEDLVKKLSSAVKDFI